jgi:ABC-type transport system involved in multi-copper enzyme maturation permease subunit
MIPVLKKELRALGPLFGLLVLMFSGDVISRPFSERLDEASWVHIASDVADPDGSSEAAILFLVFSLMVAYAAYPREHDENTIEFLYSLPVSRGVVFVVKVGCGLAVLWAAAIFGELTNFLLQLPNPQSFSGEQWDLGIAGPIVFLRGSLLTIFYCHGLFASFFRRFGVLPVVLIGVSIANLVTLSPSNAIFDPSEIVAYEVDGRSVVLPIGALVFHGALALFSLAVAALLWMGIGERSGMAFDPGKATLGGRIALGCGSAILIAAVLTIAVIGVALKSEPVVTTRPRRAPAPEYSSFDVVRETTTCCDLTFPRALEVRAAPVVRGVDAVYTEIANVVGTALPDRVAIDMTSDSDSHLGVASWTSVRVSLLDHDTETDLMRTVAHELAHTYQQRILAERAAEAADEIGFFMEGSAEWIAAQVVTSADADVASRRLAAVVWSRHRVRFEELADHDRFRARLSFLLEYPLGELFARGLAAAYGPEAIGCVLRSMSRDALEDHEGRAYWEAALATCEYSLEAVLVEVESEVARTLREEAAFAGAIPEIGGGIVGERDGSYMVVAHLDRSAPPGSLFTLAVRRHAGISDAELRAVDGAVRADGRTVDYLLPESLAGSGRFEAQYGVELGEGRAYFTEWRTLVAP